MTTDDTITRAAEVLGGGLGDSYSRAVCRLLARRLDAAGLLAKYPHLEVEGDWLIEVVNYHTCGAGPGSGAGHEPGCGTIPVGRLATPAHDAAVAARALREAADALDELQTPANEHPAQRDPALWLHERADRIEREGGESDA